MRCKVFSFLARHKIGQAKLFQQLIEESALIREGIVLHCTTDVLFVIEQKKSEVLMAVQYGLKCLPNSISSATTAPKSQRLLCAASVTTPR